MTRIAVLLAALLLPAVSAGAGEAPVVVKLETKDGLVLEADWYRGDEGMPGIVGLHMYPSDRSSWQPLAEARPPGFHFLAIDMRGYGGSALQGEEDLSPRVKSRDAALFKAMWQDAAAGIAHLRGEAKCDPKRVGLVGASVGCSVAIEAAVRDGEIAGVCVMTPGKNYLGVPTMEHLRRWQTTPLLVLSSEKEADGGARPIAAALRGRPGLDLDLRVVPGGRELHGTFMFGKVEGMEQQVAHWFEGVLGCLFPDGEIDPCEERAARDGLGGVGMHEGSLRGASRWRVDAVGISCWFRSQRADAPATFTIFVEPAPGEGPFGEEDHPEDAFVVDGMRLRGTATARGALVSGTLETWTGAAWAGGSVRERPDGARFEGRLMEVRVPWKVFGVRRGRKVRVDFTPVLGRGDWKAKPGQPGGTIVEIPE